MYKRVPALSNQTSRRGVAAPRAGRPEHNDALFIGEDDLRTILDRNLILQARLEELYDAKRHVYMISTYMPVALLMDNMEVFGAFQQSIHFAVAMLALRQPRL